MPCMRHRVCMCMQADPCRLDWCGEWTLVNLVLAFASGVAMHACFLKTKQPNLEMQRHDNHVAGLHMTKT